MEKSSIWDLRKASRARLDGSRIWLSIQHLHRSERLLLWQARGAEGLGTTRQQWMHGDWYVLTVQVPLIAMAHIGSTLATRYKPIVHQPSRLHPSASAFAMPTNKVLGLSTILAVAASFFQGHHLTDSTIVWYQQWPLGSHEWLGMLQHTQCGWGENGMLSAVPIYLNCW